MFKLIKCTIKKKGYFECDSNNVSKMFGQGQEKAGKVNGTEKNQLRNILSVSVN